MKKYTNLELRHAGWLVRKLFFPTKCEYSGAPQGFNQSFYTTGSDNRLACYAFACASAEKAESELDAQRKSDEAELEEHRKTKYFKIQSSYDASCKAVVYKLYLKPVRSFHGGKVVYNEVIEYSSLQAALDAILEIQKVILDKGEYYGESA